MMNFNFDRSRKSFGLAAFSAALGLMAAGCNQDSAGGNAGAGQVTQAPADPHSTFDANALMAKGLAHEAPGVPVRLDESNPVLPGPVLSKSAAASVNINFSDPTALSMIPYANITFVYWPGYIQSIGYSTWLYVWMSSGPGTAFLPYTDTQDHFHIMWDNICAMTNGSMGVTSGKTCVALPANTNRFQGAMFGGDWLAAYAQTSGIGRVNFDLTMIRVKGTVPISLWFKNASGWFYWNSLSPGYWNLPGATNISEFHIAATTRNANDKYSVDDIMVAPH